MPDPPFITAIKELENSLYRVSTLLNAAQDASEQLVEIGRDCETTRVILENIRQQLEWKVGSNASLFPTLLLGGADSEQDASPGVNIGNVLHNNVDQLQLDVGVLIVEIEGLKNGHPRIRGSKLGAKGVVDGEKHEEHYLKAMRQKILTKRNQLHLVQAMLIPSQAQTRTHSTSPERQQTRPVARDNSLADEMVTIFHPSTGTTQPLQRRTTGASDYTSHMTNHEAQYELIKAVEENNKHEAQLYLGGNLDPNFLSEGEEKLSPLHIAAKNGDLGMAELLLSYGARVDCMSRNGRTPLMLALTHNHPVTALALIRRGASISHIDKHGQSALHIACRKNLYAVAQVLLDNGAGPNVCDEEGRTPLMEAVRREDRDVQPHDTGIVRILLEPNRHSEAANPALALGRESGETPIAYAARKGYIDDLRVIAGSAPARQHHAVSMADNQGRTPLWHAARGGHLEAVRELIKLGRDSVNRRSTDPDNPTPIWAMTASGPSPNVLAGFTKLLHADADCTVRDTRRRTLLHRVCKTGDIDLVKLLLRRGADPSAVDDLGRQPLHCAALEGHEAVAAMLLRCEAPRRVDIDAVDEQGRTPLMVAAWRGYDYLVRFLTDGQGKGGRAADWRRKDASGCDAFYLACAAGRIICAMYLLGKGANINRKNGRGNTPLHAAARNREVETVQWLLRMGANTEAKSDEPFDDVPVAGKPAVIARAVGGEDGERIATMIEKWDPGRRRESSWKVQVEWLDAEL